MYPLRIRRRHCERSEAISSRHPTLSMAGDGFVAPLLARTKGATDVAGIIAKQFQGDAIRRGWRSAATMKKGDGPLQVRRSEEHTYELQSLMRISYDVLWLTNKTIK